MGPVLASLPGVRPAAPNNAIGQPMVVATTHGETPEVIALGLDGVPIWRKAFDARTRPEILGRPPIHIPAPTPPS